MTTKVRAAEGSEKPPATALANCLAAVADKSVQRDQVAILYADLRLYRPKGDEWGIINRAIIARWSISALQRIKRLAWQRVKPRPRQLETRP